MRHLTKALSRVRRAQRLGSRLLARFALAFSARARYAFALRGEAFHEAGAYSLNERLEDGETASDDADVHFESSVVVSGVLLGGWVTYSQTMS